MSDFDLSLTIAVDTVGTDPLSYTVVATDADLSSVRERFDLLEARSLSADIAVELRPSDKAVQIKGHLKANIVQRCVISLDPVPETLDEPFELLLVSEKVADAWDEQEAYLDPDHPDYDALEGDEIPLGEIVAQTLSIVMDDYPRAEGVEPEASVKGVTIGEPERTNPFAILKDGGDQS